MNSYCGKTRAGLLSAVIYFGAACAWMAEKQPQYAKLSIISAYVFAGVSISVVIFLTKKSVEKKFRHNSPLTEPDIKNTAYVYEQALQRYLKNYLKDHLGNPDFGYGRLRNHLVHESAAVRYIAWAEMLPQLSPHLLKLDSTFLA